MLERGGVSKGTIEKENPQPRKKLEKRKKKACRNWSGGGR